MKAVFHDRYLGSAARQRAGSIALLGCPLDATSSFRGGTKFGPESIRRASWSLETYSPYLERDLDEVAFYDAGDLELRPGDLAYSLDAIEEAITGLTEKSTRVLAFGGEHLVTYPIMKAIRRRFTGVQVIHFDAHCDLRDDYEGQALSHATVMKRVKELGPRVLGIGIRSGTRQEFQEAVVIDSPASLASRLEPGAPTYVTFDMDVLDPSLVAGVTTPEPGGLGFDEVLAYFSVIRGMRVVAADIVELAPDYDTTFVSSIAAAKVAREMLLLMGS